MTPFRTLKPGDPVAEALAAAPEGATVVFSPGHYDVNLVLPHSVTLQGGGPGAVIFDGKGRGSIVRVSGAKKSVRLQGLTLTGGGGQGAALAGNGVSSIELVDVIVRDNKAGRAATIQVDAGTLLLDRCHLSGNVGDFGAALLVDGVAKAIVRNTHIVDNRATTSAVAVRDLAEVSFEHVTIAGNHAPIALEVRATPGRLPTVKLHDSIVRAPGSTAIGNGPRLPGHVISTRSMIEGATTGEIKITEVGGDLAGAAFGKTAGAPAK